MPRIGITKESLEGLKNPPAGIYEFRLDGFKPAWAKQKENKDRTINLKPQLVIVNHPTMNDKPIFMWGNTAFGVDIFDMCHALGVQYEDESGDNPHMPGTFAGPLDGTPNEGGPQDDPAQWNYNGPLVGLIGKVELGETVDQRDNKVRTEVKRFFCKVPGCTMPHRDSLLRS